MVSPDRQTWHCFGACNTGGDIFTFLMRYENIEFFEALKMLAEKAGIELRRVDPAVARQFGVLYDLHTAAKNFYASALQAAPEVMNYSLSRGLTKETVAEFELGYAPNSRDALTVFLLKQGFSIADVERSGLALRGERGGYYDRFRGRLMFPLYDHFGKTVGFTGRILPAHESDAIAKYVNSPETPIFKKSKLFYGFHKSKSAIRESDRAFLVEGQMDLLLSWQDGIKNVLATSGTALTEDHLVFLRRHTGTLLLGFDHDEAGGNAIERAIDMAGQHDFDVKVVDLGEAKDPADYVVAKPGHLAAALNDALPAMEFYYGRFVGAKPEKKGIRLALQKIRFLGSAIDRARWLHILSERAGIPEGALAEELDAISRKDAGGPDQNRVSSAETTIPSGPPDRRSRIAESMLRYALSAPDHGLLSEMRGYLPPPYQKLSDAIVSGTTDQSVESAIALLSLQSGVTLSHSKEDLCLELKLEYLKEQKFRMHETIRRYEHEGDNKKLEVALREFDILSKQIHNLKC